jgi:Holliday junction resolvase RusA-like endonuclease
VSAATRQAWSIRLPLPPTINTGYKTGVRYVKGHGWSSRMMKTDRLISWEDQAAFDLKGWEIPKRTPLAVAVRLEVPKANLRRADIDGYLKFLLDRTIGKRNDQWIDRLDVEKVEGDGWAEVTVETLTAARTLAAALGEGER